MNKAEYIRQCAKDVISALEIANLPDRIEIDGDWIYPKVALERAKSILRADTMTALRD